MGEVTPLFARSVHETRHQQVRDPECVVCVAMERHPAGRTIPDQAAADEAVAAQDDRAWLVRRARLFTVLAVGFAVLAVVLTVANRGPFNGANLAAVLVTIVAGACAVAAWLLRDRIRFVDAEADR